MNDGRRILGDEYWGHPDICRSHDGRFYLVGLSTWHSSMTRRHPADTKAYWRGERTLFSTSKDLETFSPPARLFPWDLATIDVIVRREGDRYVAVIKDEAMPSFAWPTGKRIRVASASALTGPWSEPGPRISPNFREAPTIIPRLDGLGWYLYAEQYPGVQYTPATAPELEGPWHELYIGDYAVPPNARHGCMIALSQAELEALLTRLP